MDKLGHTGSIEYGLAGVRVRVKFITLLSRSAPQPKRHMISQHRHLSLRGPPISRPVSLHRVGLLFAPDLNVFGGLLCRAAYCYSSRAKRPRTR